MKFNIVEENQIAGNVVSCISQENYKLCYISAFPRFYQDLIV